MGTEVQHSWKKAALGCKIILWGVIGPGNGPVWIQHGLYAVKILQKLWVNRRKRYGSDISEKLKQHNWSHPEPFDKTQDFLKINPSLDKCTNNWLIMIVLPLKLTILLCSVFSSPKGQVLGSCLSFTSPIVVLLFYSLKCFARAKQEEIIERLRK